MGGTRRLLRGHYNPTNWSRKHPNLQKYKIPSGKRVLMCTRCLRTMTKPTRTLPVKAEATVASS